MRGHHFLPSHYLWSLNCVVFAQAFQTQSVWLAMLSMNHIVRCDALCWDMCSKMIVITEFCYFFFKAWNVLPCVSPIISPSFQSSKPATEGWWDARGEDNIVQRQQWRQVLIFNSAELISVSHRPLGSPLSSLSSSSWSVVQVLLAGEKMMSAHAFLVFLGHLIFWMGMFKVFRWNGLEILILKHMWKSIIGPLEQI